MKLEEWNTIRFHQKNENSFYSVQRPNDGFSITFYPLPEDLSSLANFLKYDTTVNYLSLDNYNSGNQPYSHRFKVYKGPGADWHKKSEKWQPVLDALSYNRTVIDFKAALNYEYSSIGIIIKQLADRNKKQVDSLTEFMKNEIQHFNSPKSPSEKAKYDQNFKLYQLFKGFLETRYDYHFSEATSGIHKKEFSKIVVAPTEFDSVQFEPFSAYDLYKKHYYIEKKVFNIVDNYIREHYFEIIGVAKKINGLSAQILDNNLIVAKILSYLGSDNLLQVK